MLFIQFHYKKHASGTFRTLAQYRCVRACVRALSKPDVLPEICVRRLVTRQPQTVKRDSDSSGLRQDFIVALSCKNGLPGDVITYTLKLIYQGGK